MKGAIDAALSSLLICLESRYNPKARRRLLIGKTNIYEFERKPVTVIIEARRTGKIGSS
jgi:hypothetical protein